MCRGMYERNSCAIYKDEKRRQCLLCMIPWKENEGRRIRPPQEGRRKVGKTRKTDELVHVENACARSTTGICIPRTLKVALLCIPNYVETGLRKSNGGITYRLSLLASKRFTQNLHGATPGHGQAHSVYQRHWKSTERL